MIRWRPQSLIAQTIIVLLVGLTASHLLSMVVYSGDRADALTRLGDRAAAARIADAATLVLRTPTAERDTFVARYAGLSLDVGLVAAPGFEADPMPDAETRAVAATIAERLPPGTPLRVRIETPHHVPLFDHLRDAFYGEPARATIRAAVGVDDGRWLALTALPPEQGADHSALTSMAAMVAAIVLAAVWVVRRMTAPLETLAAAARRMAREVDAPDLAETGPAEVKDAIAAFNHMRSEVRRLLENRTLMLAAISHDLRTPITLLRLRVEALEPSEEREKMLGSLDDMERMIAATLSFARQDAADEPRVALDLNALVEAMVEDMRDLGRDVAYAGPDAPVCLSCRTQALKRAIGNLIDNAVNYGGSAHVALTVEIGRVNVTVSDRGPGLPSAQLEAVFQPFYRGDASRSRATGGSGLGLSITREIASAHGGTVTLANRPGGGLVATLTLPS
ncbi:Histidine kinase [uncultured Alphaproteobacteria bacterium]|uniref:histidine kinase n=1 Tax=uncultured Alphaproteobacteria bacterium TaxID=91750 RepID=A0A212JIA1_9PROT|nr:Histidine kinase [uncultured Alphaproteobacteria bacterium]